MEGEIKLSCVFVTLAKRLRGEKWTKKMVNMNDLKYVGLIQQLFRFSFVQCKLQGLNAPIFVRCLCWFVRS